MCLGRMMNYCCPDLQKTYHGDVMPLLLRLMSEETKLKMKTQAVAGAVAFVTNLTGKAGEAEDDIDEDEKEEGKAILMQYSEALV